MHILESVEKIITKEIKDLCQNCTHAHDCVFRAISAKTIIQCELFDYNFDQSEYQQTPIGLCKNCDNAANCKLPGRSLGIWHCNEFR